MRELFAAFRPALGWMLLGMLLSLVSVLANIALLTLSSWFIAATALAGVAGALFNYLLPSVGVRAFALFRTGGRYLERLVTHNTTFRILAALKRAAYERLASTYEETTRALHSGETLGRLQHDIDTLEGFYSRGLVPVVVAVLGGTLTIGFVALFSAELAAVLALLLVLVGLVFPYAEQRSAAAAVERRAAREAELRRQTVDYVEGMTEIVLAGATQSREDQLLQAEAAHREETERLDQGAALWELATVAASGAAVVAAFFFLVPAIGEGLLPPTHAAMLTVCALVSFETVLPLRDAMVELAAARAAAARVFGAAAAEPGNGSGPALPTATAHEARAEPGHYPAGGRPPEIRAAGLSLQYRAGQTAALEQVDLELRPGSRTAVVGPVGCGKSSLIHVLTGLSRPSDGTVTPEPRMLAPHLSVLEQHPHIFHATVRENLLPARPEASEAELRAACSGACFQEVLDQLPKGLDSPVGRNGAQLSAGERKRLALARALLRPAPVLLLDEPTEYLDPDTERRVFDSVLQWAREMTLLFVTHRLVSMDTFDQVVVMDRGAVVERGTHGELLSRGGLYTDMWTMFQ